LGLIDKVLAPASSNKRPAPQWQRPKAKGKVERINPNERTVGRSGGLFVWVTFTQCDSVGSPPRFVAAEIAVAHKPVVVIGDSPALFAKPWTPAEEERLWAMVMSGMSVKDLAPELQRTIAAVRTRACLQLSMIMAEASWTPARNILASLS